MSVIANSSDQLLKLNSSQEGLCHNILLFGFINSGVSSAVNSIATAIQPSVRTGLIKNLSKAAAPSLKPSARTTLNLHKFNLSQQLPGLRVMMWEGYGLQTGLSADGYANYSSPLELDLLLQGLLPDRFPAPKDARTLAQVISQAKSPEKLNVIHSVAFVIPQSIVTNLAGPELVKIKSIIQQIRDHNREPTIILTKLDLVVGGIDENGDGLSFERSPMVMDIRRITSNLLTIPLDNVRCIVNYNSPSHEKLSKRSGQIDKLVLSVFRQLLDQAKMFEDRDPSTVALAKKLPSTVNMLATKPGKMVSDVEEITRSAELARKIVDLSKGAIKEDPLPPPPKEPVIVQDEMEEERFESSASSSTKSSLDKIVIPSNGGLSFAQILEQAKSDSSPAAVSTIQNSQGQPSQKSSPLNTPSNTTNSVDKAQVSIVDTRSAIAIPVDVDPNSVPPTEANGERVKIAFSEDSSKNMEFDRSSPSFSSVLNISYDQNNSGSKESAADSKKPAVFKVVADNRELPPLTDSSLNQQNQKIFDNLGNSQIIKRSVEGLNADKDPQNRSVMIKDDKKTEYRPTDYSTSAASLKQDTAAQSNEQRTLPQNIVPAFEAPILMTGVQIENTEKSSSTEIKFDQLVPKSHFTMAIAEIDTKISDIKCTIGKDVDRKFSMVDQVISSLRGDLNGISKSVQTLSVTIESEQKHIHAVDAKLVSASKYVLPKDYQELPTKVDDMLTRLKLLEDALPGCNANESQNSSLIINIKEEFNERLKEIQQEINSQLKSLCGSSSDTKDTRLKSSSLEQIAELNQVNESLKTNIKSLEASLNQARVDANTALSEARQAKNEAEKAYKLAETACRCSIL